MPNSITTQQQQQQQQLGPSPPQRQRRQVLSEEEYTSTLKSIITRDYYPSLPSLRRDAAVLQKRSEGDTAGAIAIRRAARRIESFEERRRMKEEEEEKEALLGVSANMNANRNGNNNANNNANNSSNNGLRKRARPLDRESVDGFHCRVTSEDNAYFERNLEKEAKEKRQKMDTILYSTANANNNANNNTNAITSNQMMLQDYIVTSASTSASDEFNAPVERIQTAGTTKDGQNISDWNSLFFTPPHYNHHNNNNNSNYINNHNSLVLTSISRATTSTGTDAHQNMNDSQIMPPPPSRPKNANSESTIILKSNEFNHPTHNQYNNKNIHDNIHNNENRHHLVEYQPKPKSKHHEFISEKQIIPQNTRFQYQNESRIVASSLMSTTSSLSSTLTSKSTLTRNKLSSNNPSYETDDSYSSMNTTTDLDASPQPLHIERKARMDQLYKERNTLVAMTPTIIPGVSSRRTRRWRNKRKYKVLDGLICNNSSSSDNNKNNNDSDDDSNDSNDDDNEMDSPIITWGKIASTPLVTGGEILNQRNIGTSRGTSTNTDDIDDDHDYDHDDTTIGNKLSYQFQLPTIDNRETVARKAEVKLSHRKQRFEEAGGNSKMQNSTMSTTTTTTTTPSATNTKQVKNSKTSHHNKSLSSVLNRKQSLTPAARSLLERSTQGGTNSVLHHSTIYTNIHNKNNKTNGKTSSSRKKVNARSNSALGSALRESYTPRRYSVKTGSMSTSMSTSTKRKGMISLIHKSTPLSSRKPKFVDSNSSSNSNSIKRNQKVEKRIKDSSSSSSNTKTGHNLTSGLLKF